MFQKCTTVKESKSLFRQLSMRLHPDHGGSNDLMTLLLDTYHDFLNTRKDFEDAPFNRRETKYKNHEYEKAFDDIFAGDKALDIIDEIFEYAKKHKRFSLEFITSVSEYLSEKGYVTAGQYNGLLKVYKSFRMWE